MPSCWLLFPARQMRLEPFQRLTGCPRRTAARQLGMCPRAHGQPDVGAAGTQVLVLLESLPQKQVLPTADQQHWDGDLVERRAEPQRLPERVVGVVVLEPRFVPWRAARPEGHGRTRPTAGAAVARASRRRDPAAQRSVCSRPCSWFATRSAQRSESVNLNAPVPQIDSAKSCGPTVMIAVASSGGGSISSAHWVEAQIRHPDRRESAGEPRLAAQPLDGVGAVGDFVDHRFELAVRSRRYPECSAARRDSRGRRTAGRSSSRERKAPAVGAADQQRAYDTRVFGGCVMVGDQVDAVAHRDLAAPARRCSRLSAPPVRTGAKGRGGRTAARCAEAAARAGRSEVVVMDIVRICSTGPVVVLAPVLRWAVYVGVRVDRRVEQRLLDHP